MASGGSKEGIYVSKWLHENTHICTLHGDIDLKPRVFLCLCVLVHVCGVCLFACICVRLHVSDLDMYTLPGSVFVSA